MCQVASVRSLTGDWKDTNNLKQKAKKVLNYNAMSLEVVKAKSVTIMGWLGSTYKNSIKILKGRINE